MKTAIENIESRLSLLGASYHGRGNPQYTLHLPEKQDPGHGYLHEVIDTLMMHAQRAGNDGDLSIRVEGGAPTQLLNLADELATGYRGGECGVRFTPHEEKYACFASAIRRNHPEEHVGRLVPTDPEFINAMHRVTNGEDMPDCSYLEKLYK